MKKFFLLILFISIFSFAWTQNYKIQAILTYNFTKYLTWPEDTLETFKIGVCGNKEYLNEIKIISKNYKVSEREIEVIDFNKTENIRECHICYISSEKKDEIEAISSRIDGLKSLVITSDFGKVIPGISINFIIKDSKQQFEIYPSTILKRDIKINPELLDMGIIKKTE